MKFCNVVQEAVIKTIPKKKKCQKAKWLSEEALQIAEKRREAKGKEEKERYTHLNAEFQKHICFRLLIMPKPLTVWITITVENSERDGNTRPPDLPLEKPICRSGSNS